MQLTAGTGVNVFIDSNSETSTDHKKQVLYSLAPLGKWIINDKYIEFCIPEVKLMHIKDISVSFFNEDVKGYFDIDKGKLLQCFKDMF